MEAKYISKYESGEAVDEALDTGISAHREVELAKGDSKGHAHSSLKSRIDSDVDQLQAQIDQIVRAPESGGDVAAEVAQARVGADGTTYQTLKERLDSETNSIKEDLTNIQNDVKNTIGINRTITPAWTAGKYIREDGTIANASDALSITEEIEILDTDTKLAKGLNSYSQIQMPAVHYYDSGHNHVGFSYAQGDYDITDYVENYNAKYIRLSHYETAEYPIEDVLILYITDGEIGGIKKDVADNKADISELKETSEVTNSLQYKNIIDGYSNSADGKYLSNGLVISGPNWCTLLDYIPAKPSTTYGIKFAEQFNKWLTVKVAYYESDKTFISDETFTNNNGVTTPNNCAYIRLSITNKTYEIDGHNDFSTAYMEEVEDGQNVVVVDNTKYIKNTFPLTTLSGKKWALFGDSITENNFRSSANYHDYIRAETGIITLNKGVGGSGYKNRDDTNNAFYQIAIKTINEWNNADVITVMGGVNDLWSQIDVRGLGTPSDVFVEPSDITTQTTNTVMACFNKMLDVLISNSDSRIGVISPLPCYTTHSGNAFHEVPYDEDCNMSKFVEACKKSCELHGIPYLDLFHNSGLRPWDNDFNAKFFKCISSDSPDGLHPNELGHKFFYPIVREFLKSLV